jgi:formyltetrahydrofolate deformylase
MTTRSAEPQPDNFPPPPGGPPPPADMGRLLLRCHDRPGLIAAVSNFLAQAGANIISLDQHSTAPEDGTFLQRAIFHLPGLTAAIDELERKFAATVADKFNIDYRFTEAAKPKWVAIMASKDDHCLLDLLWRNRRGELQMSVVTVIANHPNLAEHVRPFGVPFIRIPATRDTHAEAEQRQLQLLSGNGDLVVLARYMQILSPAFLDAIGCPLINIHHSFLPAFIGAAPYKRENAVSSWSARPPTTSPRCSTRGRSSNKTSYLSTTPTPSTTWCASAPTSNARCYPAPCSATARTASSCTTTRPSFSEITCFTVV